MGRRSRLLGLRDGVQLRTTRAAGSGESRSSVVSFSELTLDREFRFESLPFRVRGANERELTLRELWSERANPSGEVPAARLDSEWHGRIARIVSPLLLPLIAMPLGLASRRSHRGFGIVIALLVLALYMPLFQLSSVVNQ